MLKLEHVQVERVVKLVEANECLRTRSVNLCGDIPLEALRFAEALLVRVGRLKLDPVVDRRLGRKGVVEHVHHDAGVSPGVVDVRAHTCILEDDHGEVLVEPHGSRVPHNRSVGQVLKLLGLSLVKDQHEQGSFNGLNGRRVGAVHVNYVSTKVGPVVARQRGERGNLRLLGRVPRLGHRQHPRKVHLQVTGSQRLARLGVVDVDAEKLFEAHNDNVLRVVGDELIHATLGHTRRPKDARVLRHAQGYRVVDAVRLELLGTHQLAKGDKARRQVGGASDLRPLKGVDTVQPVPVGKDGQRRATGQVHKFLPPLDKPVVGGRSTG
mmetsp:Transcript_12112/g.38445  ORF Transcript_12112/g.38445 Transcript_12112/m.38445 type:complete len:324 (+) Transcript_12112:700-1671(+)